jgi:hypothetical protein
MFNYIHSELNEMIRKNRKIIQKIVDNGKAHTLLRPITKDPLRPS